MCTGHGLKARVNYRIIIFNSNIVTWIATRRTLKRLRITERTAGQRQNIYSRRPGWHSANGANEAVATSRKTYTPKRDEANARSPSAQAAGKVFFHRCLQLSSGVVCRSWAKECNKTISTMWMKIYRMLYSGAPACTSIHAAAPSPRGLHPGYMQEHRVAPPCRCQSTMR